MSDRTIHDFKIIGTNVIFYRPRANNMMAGVLKLQRLSEQFDSDGAHRDAARVRNACRMIVRRLIKPPSRFDL